MTPHVIRHTTAMHLLHAEVDITAIAAWLGAIAERSEEVASDRLAELGVDSLTRVELVAQIEARFSLRVDDRSAASLGRVQDVFDLL